MFLALYPVAIHSSTISVRLKHNISVTAEQIWLHSPVTGPEVVLSYCLMGCRKYRYYTKTTHITTIGGGAFALYLVAKPLVYNIMILAASPLASKGSVF